MNYFYSIIPPEIQEIIIQNVASLIIQEKWLNFINTKLELERYFIRIKPKNMNKYKFNLFDINFVFLYHFRNQPKAILCYLYFFIFEK